MIWDEERQLKFIEFVFLGLLIFFIFVVDINDIEDEVCLEIIDGI